MKTRLALPLICMLLLPCPGTLEAAMNDTAALDISTTYAYHVRLVRISSADTGTALGYGTDAEPVVLPEYEAWGSPEQLAGLAQALGGQAADPVTGFFIRPEGRSVVSFQRKVYIGEEVLDLSFLAYPPESEGLEHELVLEVDRIDSGSDPLVEARVRVNTDRTVAIAGPLPADDDWLILAVTLVDQEAVAAQYRTTGKILKATDQEITRPELMKKVAPVYPDNAKRNKLNGEVILQAIIDRDGVPRAPTVMAMDIGCEELAAAAVDAISRWRYSPATLNGRPVAVYMTINVRFQLR